MKQFMNEIGEPFGPIWNDEKEMIEFFKWHDKGEQRTLAQTFEDGELEAQIEWWHNGGHLVEE